MVVGNIALVQVQATVAAFLVSCFSLGVGAALNGTFNFQHAMLLTASSMFTATTSCFVLGEIYFSLVRASLTILVFTKRFTRALIVQSR